MSLFLTFGIEVIQRNGGEGKNEQVIRLESSKCQHANSLFQCLNVVGEFKKKFFGVLNSSVTPGVVTKILGCLFTQGGQNELNLTELICKVRNIQTGELFVIGLQDDPTLFLSSILEELDPHGNLYYSSLHVINYSFDVRLINH